jgi:hypothetical protein
VKLRKEIECILRAILYSKSQICLVCDENDMEKYFDDFRTLNDQHKILQDEIKTMENAEIVFKNGSSIKIITPSKPEETVRGNRAKIHPWSWEWEHPVIDDELFEEVLKPFMNNK